MASSSIHKTAGFETKGLFKQWYVNRWKVQPETLHKGFVPECFCVCLQICIFPLQSNVDES